MPYSQFPLAQRGRKWVSGQNTCLKLIQNVTFCFVFCFCFVLFALFVWQRSLWRIYAFRWLKVTFKILSSSLCHTSCFISEYVHLQNKVQNLEKDTCTHTYTHETQTQKSLGTLAPASYPPKVFNTCFNLSKPVPWERSKVCTVLSFRISSFPYQVLPLANSIPCEGSMRR